MVTKKMLACANSNCIFINLGKASYETIALHDNQRFKWLDISQQLVHMVKKAITKLPEISKPAYVVGDQTFTDTEIFYRYGNTYIPSGSVTNGKFERYSLEKQLMILRND